MSWRASTFGRCVLASAALGALWVASGGALQALRWFTQFEPAAVAVLPQTMPGQVWLWPAPWGALTVLAGALAVAALTCLIVYALHRRGGLRRRDVWLAAVIAGTVVGLLTDVARVVSLLSDLGLRSSFSVVDFGSFAASGAHWGALYGWVGALLLGATAGAAAQRDPAKQQRGNTLLLVLAAVAVVLCASHTVIYTAGSNESRRVDNAAAAEAERIAAEEAGVPRTGAAPDPEAEGVAVPTRAEDAPERDPEWCPEIDTTLMFGEPDAATGHRVLPLRVVNGGDVACVIEGYPDIVFGDQNDHLLDVDVTHGGSFMVSEDPGSTRVVLQPGEWAISYIGWNANSTHGALVAATVHSALMPGDERHGWPPRYPLDIAEGSTVAVTAWAADGGPTPAAEQDR